MHELACLLGGGHLASKLLHQPHRALHKLHVAYRQDSVTVIDVVLHTYANIATHGERHCAERQLVFTDAHNLPSRAFRQRIEHGQKIGRCRRDAALDAKDEAEMQGRLQRTTFDKIKCVLYLA